MTKILSNFNRKLQWSMHDHLHLLMSFHRSLNHRSIRFCMHLYHVLSRGLFLSLELYSGPFWLVCYPPDLWLWLVVFPSQLFLSWSGPLPPNRTLPTRCHAHRLAWRSFLSEFGILPSWGGLASFSLLSLGIASQSCRRFEEVGFCLFWGRGSVFPSRLLLHFRYALTLWTSVALSLDLMTVNFLNSLPGSLYW